MIELKWTMKRTVLHPEGSLGSIGPQLHHIYNGTAISVESWLLWTEVASPILPGFEFRVFPSPRPVSLSSLPSYLTIAGWIHVLAKGISVN